MNGNHSNQQPDQPAPHSPEERFATLWTDYLEGDLDADGMADINALLAADEQLVMRAADLYQMHRRLSVLASQQPDDANAAHVSASFVDDVIRRLPGDGETLARAVMARIAPFHDDLPAAATRRRGARRWDRLLVGARLMVAAAVPADTRVADGSRRPAAEGSSRCRDPGDSPSVRPVCQPGSPAVPGTRNAPPRNRGKTS